MALIISHLQNDFCDGGPMANENSLNIIPIINRIRQNYNYIIFINYCHQYNHSSFKQYGGTCPKYCIENTKGCEMPSGLIVKESDIIINVETLQKYSTSSGFYDSDVIEKLSRLKNILQINNIRELYFCGNDMDSFIFSTIMDAINFKFKCHIITDAIGYVNKEKATKKIEYLKTMGVINI